MGKSSGDPVEAEDGCGSAEGQGDLLKVPCTPFAWIPYRNDRQASLRSAHREVLVGTGDIPQSDHQLVGQDFLVPLEPAK